MRKQVFLLRTKIYAWKMKLSQKRLNFMYFDALFLLKSVGCPNP